MIQRKLFPLFLLILANAHTQHVQAEDFYIGASGLLTSYNDGNNVPYKLNAGYNFNQYFAIELNYIDAGEKDYRDNSGDLKGTAYSAEFLAKYPIGDFSVYAKLGNMWWQQKGDIVVHMFAASYALVDQDEKGSSINYGLGVDYKITRSFHIKAEYLESKINDDNANHLALGINIAF